MNKISNGMIILDRLIILTLIFRLKSPTRIEMKNLLFLSALGWALLSCDSLGTKEDSKTGRFHTDDILFHNEHFIESKAGEKLSGVIYNESFEIEVLNGKCHGKFIGFNEEGTVSMEGFFKEGFRDSLWKTYEDGLLTSTFSFRSGRFDGLMREWSDGVLKSEVTYVQGNKHGVEKIWDEKTKNLVKLRTYKMGTLDGLQMNCSKRGDTLGITRLVNGNGQFKYKDEEEAQIEQTDIYKQGKLDGLCKKTKNGSLIMEVSYENNLKNGLEKTFEEGKEITRKTYAKGILHGEFKQFDAVNGQLILEGNYSQGKKKGLWKSYGEEGQLTDEINFIDGKASGIHRSWTIDGGQRKLTLEESYSKGLKNGTTKKWSPYTFDLISEMNYLNGQLEGTAKAWSSGKLISEKVFKDGKIQSQICWDELGNKIDCFAEEPSPTPTEDYSGF